MEGAKNNTDKELFRETLGDYYSPSLFVTEGGGIGIDVGGHVYVKTLKGWHNLESKLAAALEVCKAVKAKPIEMQEIMRKHNLKIDDLADPMQKLAFTFYTALCELDNKVTNFEFIYGPIGGEGEKGR